MELNAGREKKSWRYVSSVKGQHRMFLSFFRFYKDRRSDGRQAWVKNSNDDCWKADDSAMFFISYYTPVFNVGLASKQATRIDLSC